MAFGESIMPKSYIRFNIEFDSNSPIAYETILSVKDNIQRILNEDMPYLKIVFIRTASKEEQLDFSDRFSSIKDNK